MPVHNLLEWKQKFYNFVGMSNGYFDAMIIFTKISKQGGLSVIFIDNSHLQLNTEQECINNIKATVNLLLNTGFAVHQKKFVLITTQKIEFLGFIIDSSSMTMKINGERIAHFLFKI